MLRNHLVRMQPSLRHLAPAQLNKSTESGNQYLQHVMHIWDQSLRAQLYIILRQSHGQVTMIPGQAQHITAVYSADSRNRTPLARVSLQIQKPKPQASIKNKIEKIHKLFDAYNAIHKRWGWGNCDGNVTTTTNKTHNPALTAWF